MIIQGVPPKYIQLNGNPTMYRSSMYHSCWEGWVSNVEVLYIYI
jgi:hypothetical protein